MQIIFYCRSSNTGITIKCWRCNMQMDQDVDLQSVIAGDEHTLNHSHVQGLHTSYLYLLFNAISIVTTYAILEYWVKGDTPQLNCCCHIAISALKEKHYWDVMSNTSCHNSHTNTASWKSDKQWHYLAKKSKWHTHSLLSSSSYYIVNRAKCQY